MHTKLNPAAAAEIRRRAEAGEHYRDLAEHFGAAPSHIRNIINGGIWREPQARPTSRREPLPPEVLAFWIERAGLAR